MTGHRDGLARSVQTRLARHAKGINTDPNLVMTRYAVERFLYRLSRSPHVDRFVLKGALLMLAWLGDTLRPTRDADLLGFGDLSASTNPSSKTPPSNGSGSWAMRSGTGRISRPVNRRRSGIRLARWCWWGACARPSGG
jgi:hypothetical protein